MRHQPLRRRALLDFLLDRPWVGEFCSQLRVRDRLPTLAQRTASHISPMRLSVLLLLLFTSIRALAQAPSTEPPPALYEGQTVSAVDLIANPHRQVEQFRDSIAQKAAEPYSQQKVQASISALQFHGFDKVTVNVIPDISGLRLDFILEPAYYLGMVDFYGIMKSFSYTRLLQVVNLQQQDPYDQARIPLAKTALSLFLQQNGYFQAQVQSRWQIDDANQLVNVAFSVQLGKQARIGTVALRGPTASEQTWLLHKLRSLRARFTGALVKPGKAYSPERIEAATKLMKRSLEQQHYLASKVHESPPQYHAETNKVDVAFEIEAGQLIQVQITGARLSAIP